MADHRSPTKGARPEGPAPVEIGWLHKAVVLGLLGLGLVVFWMLLTRRPQPRPIGSPRPTQSPVRTPRPFPSSSAARQPVAIVPPPDLNSIRAHLREDQPVVAVKEVALVMEAAADLVVIDQALVELEQNMERIDRKILYQVLDEYTKKATGARQIHVARYLNALAASKTFLFERYRIKKAIEDLETLASDRNSPLAPLALNKKAMLQVSQSPTEAIASFSRQIREFPDCALNGFASLMIGTCHRALEQDERALAQYQETLDKYRSAYGEGGIPLEPFVRHALADTMIKMGNREGARKELEQIIASFKGYPYLGIIEETLQSLPAAGKSGSKSLN